MAGSRSRSIRMKKTWQFYLFLLPAVSYFLIFHYYPMYGLVIAFKDYSPALGFWRSPWVGLEHFLRFFQSYYFWTLLKNTLLINLYELCLFPLPIILSLMLNEVSQLGFKKFVQSVTYAPHFISTVVMVGMITTFLNPDSGIVNLLIRLVGMKPVSFMSDARWFKSVFVWSGVWQNLGWGAIVYLAAMTAINPELHEAARMDGASRMQRIRFINLPAISPTIIILLILGIGRLMSVGFEKIYLMQNPLNMDSSDVIQTFVYRSGLLQAQFSFATAVGLFNNVINFVILVVFNGIARRSETSLW